MTLKRQIPKVLIICQVFLILLIFHLQAQPLSKIESNRISLPNGWHLTPVGKQLPLGDLPLNIALSPSEELAAVTNNGQSVQTIQLIDLNRQVIIDSIMIGKSWLGLTFSADGKYLYASGGNDNIIIRYSIKNRHLANYDTIRIGEPWPIKISVAGIALDDANKKLYAVSKENNSLYVIDIVSGNVTGQYPLGGEGYTCLLSADHKTLYISCWGCDKIILFDTYQQQISGSIQVGDNPNDLCITKNEQWLFVANANDNSVSVIDTKQRKVVETLNTALYPDAPSGSTPNSVALSEDDRMLFIANADNNCLAVFDVSIPGSSKSKGFIPTGWYPTCVRIAKGKVLVSNGKGLSSMANPYGPNPVRPGGAVVYRGGKEQIMKVQYIKGLFKGSLSFFKIPDERHLALYSQAVYNNTPYNKNKETIAEGMDGNPVPKKVGDKSPVKYVFYIIKENRTYDQVLGDMPEGNGDPNLVLFGEKITPNQHALAREFVLLDNFYADGEVSADGHNWSLGAYATDYLEKTWVTDYGHRGGTYDAEGNREIANNKNGFLWDDCRRHGISYRTYGEFVDNFKPNIPVLKNHFCTYFTCWDQSVLDTVRFSQWKRDFDSLLAAGSLTQLNTLRFINDHTQGLSIGKRTPFAQVADNDLAVGKFVDYLSHSQVWNESLVIIVEDDAQDGPDHVDAHRSTAYLAGGYIKQGFVDHTIYSTSSLLRTIELILGLPPMSQYDAAAVSLWRCFNSSPGHPPFKTKPCLVNLDEKNIARNSLQALSEQFDFSKEDRVKESDFNEVLWKAVKGFNSPCPPAVHAAFFMAGYE